MKVQGVIKFYRLACESFIMKTNTEGMEANKRTENMKFTVL